MTVLEREAKITAQGQITVPAPIREILGVHSGDHITFSVDDDGVVVVRGSNDLDPTFASFLRFLDSDIRDRPQAVQPMTGSVEGRLRKLTADTIIDRDRNVIDGDVGL